MGFLSSVGEKNSGDSTHLYMYKSSKKCSRIVRNIFQGNIYLFVTIHHLIH